MDALALLCNLHADGPTTLDELHRIGVRGLADVLAFEARGLVGELGWNPPAAERFVREAGHLAARLGETLVDPAGAFGATEDPEDLEPFDFEERVAAGEAVEPEPVRPRGDAPSAVPAPPSATPERDESERDDSERGAPQVGTPAGETSPWDADERDADGVIRVAGLLGAGQYRPRRDEPNDVRPRAASEPGERPSTSAPASHSLRDAAARVASSPVLARTRRTAAQEAGDEPREHEVARDAGSTGSVPFGAGSIAPAPSGRPRGGVDAVLEHWRELDERAPLAPPPAPVVAEPAPGTPIAEAVAAALEPGSLERLAEMGIGDLEHLVAAPTLELARGLRTGYSRAVRLQFLGRRALAEAASAASTPGGSASSQLAPSAAAGPFA